MAVSQVAALVTGASRGIGAGVARRLGGDGYAVLVNYVGDKDAAESVVEEIRQAGGTAAAYRADVSDPEQARQLVAAAGELAPLAVVVNNAGLEGTVARLDEQSDDALRRLVDVNVMGVLLICREAVRVMARSYGGAGGCIVNIASVAARTGGLPGLVAYSATKGAVVTLSRGLSTEVAGEGVRVNSISPGTIETDMTTPEFAAAGRQAPIGRLGSPRDVAGAVSWLVSPDAEFITGIDLTVAGGR
jgi:NAD(P)-dependent dehydrogenase (short-subunit alcohol dehydrogenase family)